ncbi:hypothetical protein GJAV_G00170690 [Gymnothorax javanicus]|nr:hypothetical protein GJAV_G00170690 [Gymnothorax javanicus]
MVFITVTGQMGQAAQISPEDHTHLEPLIGRISVTLDNTYVHFIGHFQPRIYPQTITMAACMSKRILVGAPQARGRKAQRHTRPGALYRCPVTAEEHDCERVDIDEEIRTDRESKHNQWLGVTVKSQGVGGKVVTCAHLYELRQRVHEPSETRDPIGRCYVLSEDLTERDDLDGGEWKFCEGRPQGHEQFGFCQQGLAASFTPDNNFILFGAPGTYNWKGELRVQLINQSLLNLGFYDDGPYEVADEKEQNARLIPVPFHSYLGTTRPAPAAWAGEGSRTDADWPQKCTAAQKNASPSCTTSAAAEEVAPVPELFSYTQLSPCLPFPALTS